MRRKTQTKLYVDGFHIDLIDTPTEDANLREVAMTPKVKELLEDRQVVTIVAVPKERPKFILITTELE